VRPPTQVVRLAGRQIAIDDAGPGSGFPVIVHYVHYAGSRHLFPGAVRDAQANGLRLIGYDRPGQGKSTPQPGRIVADCAEDVRAILTHLGVSRAAVWGHRLGVRTPSPPPAHSRWLADRIPRVTAHFPAGEDHTNVEENNRNAAIAWVRSHI
jgi:pimeloyl-ACP methyl ester carboxylesterase